MENTLKCEDVKIIMIDLVELNKVGLQLGSQTVLKEVSLQASKGELHCFLGPNGAGKTMTNKLLSLLYRASSGSITWDGNQVNPFLNEEHRIETIRKLGYMSQKPIFLDQSLKSNVGMPLYFQNVPEEERGETVMELLDIFNLTELQDKKPAKLSIGQQQKAALLRAIVHTPQLLILDEPTASLDMANVKWFEEFIRGQVLNGNKIVFWTTHDQFQAKRVADVIHVIINGTLVESGTPEEIFEHPRDEKVQKYVRGELF